MLLNSRLNRSVTSPVSNATCDESSRSNDVSRTSSVELSVQQLHRRLNVQRDLSGNNSRRANVSQHQLDRRNSSNSNDA